MPKSASASVVSSPVTARARGTAARKRGTGRTSKAIDPAVRRALLQQDISGPLTVMVKLDTNRSEFGKLPVTNRPGSARERAFVREVAEEVQGNASLSRHYRILSAAANVGVATVEASADIFRDLVRSAKVTGMKLKTG